MQFFLFVSQNFIVNFLSTRSSSVGRLVGNVLREEKEIHQNVAVSLPSISDCTTIYSFQNMHTIHNVSVMR